MIEMYKSIAVILLFSYASIMDYRYMEVPNGLWEVMFPFGVLFFAVEMWVAPSPLDWIILPCIVGATVIVASLANFIGYLGAADAKGLMVLSLYFPHWHGNLTFIGIVLSAAITLTLPITLYYYYQLYMTKDIFEADKIRRHTPFFPYLLAGFVLALFITPIAGA
jgi:Flp pilus assembly protein protease CpaA